MLKLGTFLLEKLFLSYYGYFSVCYKVVLLFLTTVKSLQKKSDII